MAEVFDNDLRSYLNAWDRQEDELVACKGCGMYHTNDDLDGNCYCETCLKYESPND